MSQPAPAPSLSKHAASGADSPQAAPTRVRSVTTKSLSQFGSTKDLMAVMLDAITAHKALYEIGGVLHGDINNNTIVILETSDGHTNGALVDFDLPYAMPPGRKIGDPDQVAPPPQTYRPYYWRAPGV